MCFMNLNHNPQVELWNTLLNGKCLINLNKRNQLELLIFKLLEVTSHRIDGTLTWVTLQTVCVLPSVQQ